MLEEGMYINCSLQNPDGETLEVAGRIDVQKKTDITALGFERAKGSGFVAHRFKIPYENAVRVRLKSGSKVIINGQESEIVAKSKKLTPKGHYCYWCKIGNTIYNVSEEKILASYEDYDSSLEYQFLNRKNGSLENFISRYEIEYFIDKKDSITDGYDAALGKRIELYEHQIDTVQKVLSNRPYRAILADEVGLGKTIEALVILNYLIKKSVCKNAIVVVPDQLVYQWQIESQEKFNLDVSIFSYVSYVRGKRNTSILLVSFENFLRYADDYLFDKKWDLMIVDEVHKSLHNKKLYSSLLKLCKKVNNRLLLSATPIMKRNIEYYNLLRLLYPAIYCSITVEQFERIMEIRSQIEREVAGIVSDIRYAFDDEVIPEYFDRLRAIAVEIADYKLKTLLENASITSIENQKSQIKRAILYLQKAYELESKFIRHRRADILDVSAKRILSRSNGFYLKGEDKLSKESVLYDMLTREIQENGKINNIDADRIINIVNAFFSSASALNEELIKDDLYIVFPETNKLSHFERIKENNTLSNSRIEEMINYLNSAKDEKIVIFSDFELTVHLVYNRLVKEYGADKVVLFSFDESDAKMQIAANTFKRNLKARFLVCDKNGAEGRNFQFADVIYHFDIPWSPARLEQRIGRLDRIGRKPGHNVKNVVSYIRDTVEEDLYTLYSDCLNIFDESLCGIEIIFDELWETIRDTISERGLFGFSYVVELISELKDKCDQVLFEESLDLECINEELAGCNTAKQMVQLFSDEEKKKFYDSIFKWYFDSGYGITKANLDQMNCYHVSSILRDKLMAKKRKCFTKSGGDNVFSYHLETANTKESVELIGIDTPIVQNVIKSVAATTYGKVLAIALDGSVYDWKGFIITWKVDFNQLDSMGKDWSRLNYGIKNDYISETRLSLTYALSVNSLLAEEVIEVLKNSLGKERYLSNDEIEEIIDYGDINEYLYRATYSTKEDFLDSIRNGIDYTTLNRKIEFMREEKDVNELIGRKNSYTERMISVYESIKRMLTEFDAEIESIIFVNISKE